MECIYFILSARAPASFTDVRVCVRVVCVVGLVERGGEREKGGGWGVYVVGGRTGVNLLLQDVALLPHESD